MSSWPQSLKAQKAISLLKNEPAPYYGILITEPRFRQFKEYEEFYKTNPQVTEELLELRVVNSGLKESCDCTPVKDVLLWTLLGLVVGLVLPHP